MLLWIYCFRLFFIRTFVCLSISWSTAWNFRIFQGLFTVQLSMYSQRFALSLEVASQLPSRFFNLTRRCHLSATAYLLYHSVNRLSTTFLFFFCFFLRSALPVRCSRGQLVYIIIIILECQPHFRRFKKESFRFWIVLIVHTIQNHSFSLPTDYRIT